VKDAAVKGPPLRGKKAAFFCRSQVLGKGERRETTKKTLGGHGWGWEMKYGGLWVQ